MSAIFFGKPKTHTPKPRADCCPEKPHYGLGWCFECWHRARAEAATVKGQLRAAREGLEHAIEVRQYFEETAMLAPARSCELDQALELAADWQRCADGIASEIVELEKILARDRRAQRAAVNAAATLAK